MRFLLADDHDLFVEGLGLLLSSVIFPSCDIVKAGSWVEVSAVLEANSFDLVLVDLYMPGKSDWKNELSQLVKLAGDTPVCVITSSPSRESLHTAFELGAKGYIHKSFSPEMLQTALHKVLDGNIFFPGTADMPLPQKVDLRKYSLITARQLEILNLLAEGKGNQQIADLLGLKESTVKRHVYNICKALKVRNRGEAVHVGRQMGLLKEF